MQIKQTPLSDLHTNEANPRTITDGKFGKLIGSLLVLPKMLELRPIVTDSAGTALGGNMRLRALQAIADLTPEDVELRLHALPDFAKKSTAQQLALIDYWRGWLEDAKHPVPSVVADELSDGEKREFIIKDNASFGEWDWDALSNEWDTAELNEWGLDVWEPTDEGVAADAQEDDFDEGTDAITVRCKPGDIWQLGDHRLMCGDSVDLQQVKALMGGARADIAFSSPPYNAGFGANITKDNGRSKYIEGDDNLTQEQYRDFLNKYISNAMQFVDYNFVNIQLLANNKQSVIDVINDHRKELADILVWDKGRSQPAAAANVLNSEWEFVFVFSPKGNRAIGTIPFHGTLKNIVHISPDTTHEYSEIHNATFPVAFPHHFISNFAKDSVLDLFGGTGTTMVAAEQLGRKCYMMELNPHYCDVIIARWEKLTGQTATRLTS